MGLVHSVCFAPSPSFHFYSLDLALGPISQNIPCLLIQSWRNIEPRQWDNSQIGRFIQIIFPNISVSYEPVSLNWPGPFSDFGRFERTPSWSARAPAATAATTTAVAAAATREKQLVAKALYEGKEKCWDEVDGPAWLTESQPTASVF